MRYLGLLVFNLKVRTYQMQASGARSQTEQVALVPYRTFSMIILSSYISMMAWIGIAKTVDLTETMNSSIMYKLYKAGYASP